MMMAMPPQHDRKTLRAWSNPYAALIIGKGASQINCTSPYDCHHAAAGVTNIEGKNVAKLNTVLTGCMEHIPRTKPSKEDKMVFAKDAKQYKVPKFGTVCASGEGDIF